MPQVHNSGKTSAAIRKFRPAVYFTRSANVQQAASSGIAGNQHDAVLMRLFLYEDKEDMCGDYKAHRMRALVLRVQS